MSFLTGSRIYGTPREDSDIDLVALVTDSELKRLFSMADNREDLGSPGGENYEDGTSLRFGKLNLLCVTERKHYDVWKLGTEQLTARKPVTRDDAISHLAALRQDNRISGW